MMRRIALSLTAALATSCGGADPPGGSSGAAARPGSVILIVVDTLRSDHLGCYGYGRDTSPHIDALAAGAVRFERSLSQAPWTTPSIGALLTSRYASALGVQTKNAALPDDAETLAEVLRAHGFATGAVVSHSFCSSRWNFDQGFDWFDEANALGHDAIVSPGVTEKALAFLDEHADEPFFLWVHYFDPHFAYNEHGEFPFSGPEGYAGPVQTGMGFNRLSRIPMGKEDVEQVVAFYDAEIAYTDRHVGMLLERLEELGLYDDAMIVLTADHGEEFFERGRIGHAKTLYQEVLHVPLIVKAPGLTPRVASETVSLLDVSPTILDALGIEARPGMAGRSLLSGADDPRPVFSETSLRANLRSVVAGRFKLVWDLDRDGFSLFDLEADPGETTDVSAGHPDELEGLRSALQVWSSEVRRERIEGVQLDLTEDELSHLRELGYAGD